MILKKVSLSLLFVLFASQVYAGSNSTFDFLRNDVSARASALGGSFLLASNDPNAIFYNPSRITTVTTRQISFGYFKHLLDINSGHLSYAQELSGFGYIGGGIVYTNYGEFVKRNEFGVELGKFTANEIAMSVGYANQLAENLTYGASLKLIYSSIEKYKSTAVAFDWGVTYVISPDKFQVGASLLNLGTQLDPYMNTKESLPTDLKVGASVKPEHLPLVVNFSFNKLIEKQNNFMSRFKAFSIGGEFTVTQNIQFRFGYNNEKRTDLKIGKSAGLAGFSLGGGFVYNEYKVDYAFNSMGKISGFHRISIGIVF